MLRQKQRFLEAFRQHGNITRACDEAAVRDKQGQVLEPGPERNSIRRWVGDDPEFAEALATAREEAADYAEYELWRRGVLGVEKPVYYQGARVGSYREYSDQLLLAQVRKLRPAEWREQQAIDVRTQAALTVTTRQDLSRLDEAELEALETLLGKVALPVSTPTEVPVGVDEGAG